MVAAFLQTHRSLMTSLAKSWLDSGVERFEVWSGYERLACWPPSEERTGPYTSAPIWISGKEAGQLKVAGCHTAEYANRLQADASFIAEILTCDNNTSAMAAELIATRDQLIAMYDLTRSASTLLDLDQTLEFLAQETAQLTHASSAVITLKLPDVDLKMNYFPELLIDKEKLLQQIDALKANKSNYWFVTGGLENSDDGSLNLLLVPLHVRGADIAAIGIHTDIQQVALSPIIKILQTIADYTAVRIENLLMVRESIELTKLQAEMELAKNIQASLLPKKIPLIQGLDLWAISKPAEMVGGDFFDIIEKADNRLTFAVGDISGKGIPASIPMATARALIHFQTEAFLSPSPQSILCSLNDELFKDFTDLEMFATVFVGQYYTQSSQIQYANAGHSPVIYKPHQGKAQLLKADGIPLGLLATATYGNHFINLSPEDLLIIGTDSFYESLNMNKEAFGLERLLTQVNALARRSAKEIGTGLMEALENFQGKRAQDDDRTLIVIKRTTN